jgi:hypothetical protein
MLLASRERKISNVMLPWDTNLECCLIVRYKSQILLADCEIQISNIVNLWWDTSVRCCYLIVSYKSQILLAYCETQISNIGSLWWDIDLMLLSYCEIEISDIISLLRDTNPTIELRLINQTSPLSHFMFSYVILMWSQWELLFTSICEPGALQR